MAEDDAAEWPDLASSDRLWTLDLNPDYRFIDGHGVVLLFFNGGARRYSCDWIDSTNVTSFCEFLRNTYLGEYRLGGTGAKFDVVHRLGVHRTHTTMLIRPEEIVEFHRNWNAVEGGTILVKLKHGSGDRVQMRVTVETLEKMHVDWWGVRRMLGEVMLEGARMLEQKGDGDHAIAQRVRRFFMFC